MSAGADFATVEFPKSFAGFSDTQNYAVGAFAIWLENKYPGSLLRIYQNLNYNPLNWYDSRAAVVAGTGADSFSSIISNFGIDYWLQNFEPISGLGFGLVSSKIIDWNGIRVGGNRAPYSSTRYNVEASAAFKPSIQTRRAVVRASGLAGTSTLIYVYGDTTTALSAPANPQLLKTLSSSTPNAELGSGRFGDFLSYRLIVVNFSNQSTQPSVLIVVPNISNVSPLLGNRTQPVQLTLTGVGFGSAQGSISIGGFSPASVQSWQDNRIVFTTPVLAAGAKAITVTTASPELVESNAVTYTAN